MVQRRGRIQCLLLSVALILPLASYARPAGSPREIVSLDGPGWKLIGLKPGEGEKRGIPLRASLTIESIPTSVPNDVQLAIGLKDPLGQGPETWDINKREWWYLRTFSSPPVRPAQQARLVFDGVDYFADVWLNGEELGGHEGAYTHFTFDVTKRLHAKGHNYLAVRVTSPWKVPRRSHYEFMKGEFDEWWDALPGPGQVVFPLGIHRSVRLEVTSASRVEELQVATTRLRDGTAAPASSPAEADLQLRVTVTNTGLPRTGSLRLSIRPENFTGPALELPPRHVSFSGQPGESQIIELAAQIEQPKLWWTWDQGPQNLYTAEAVLADGEGSVIDRLSTTFGIRTIEREDHILYKLNGRPVFLRGAWLAMSKLYPADTDVWTYEKDLRLARHANMNHLVNYTVVEKDEFYELADRLGMLLFIELPFNQEGPIDALNKNYARRDEFIQWSSEEVAKIVRSLANHPSVGVWSAVSEVTGNGADFTTAADPRIAEAADGYAMFVKEMEEVVKQNDPDALYFRSYCDFGEHHFWEGAFFNGTTYDQQFDAKTGFVSEYGALAFFPLEDIHRSVSLEDYWRNGNAGGPRYSLLALPIKVQKISSVHGWQYFGLDFLTGTIAANVDRHVRSLHDLVSDSQVYQAFLYGYAADAYRRKLFAPINGVRSWMFKSFPQKPVSGFGVIDAFDTPTMGYYVQKRTYAPVTMSFALRYALESLPAGSGLKVPVWISNTAEERLSLDIDCTLYDLKGKRLLESHAQSSVPGRQAREVFNLEWQVPERPGVYLVRGHAKQLSKLLASAEMYVKVVPRATRRRLRVLVLGTPDWAQPVADYVTNLGASTTPVVYEPTVIREPKNPFPASAADLLRNYDVIWLAGFDDYWREAPEHVTQVIARAVRLGATFVHTGSWGSFHGGSERAAALDLTPMAEILPVEVQHENDIVPKTSYRTGIETNDSPASSRSGSIASTDLAPQWLRDTNFTGLVPENYHVLKARPDAKVLLQMGGRPLLVSAHCEKGLTLAYLGFSPETEGGRRVRDYEPVIVDRVVRSSAQGRLFAIVTASLLALASGEDPSAPLADLVESRTTPVFESLKNLSSAPWPKVTLTWTHSAQNNLIAQIHISNGPEYLRGFSLRFEGPDFREGNVLALWSNQFFDLLPDEEADADVELVTRSKRFVQNVSLEAQTLYGTDSRVYSIPAAH